MGARCLGLGLMLGLAVSVAACGDDSGGGGSTCTRCDGGELDAMMDEPDTGMPPTGGTGGGIAGSGPAKRDGGTREQDGGFDAGMPEAGIDSGERFMPIVDAGPPPVPSAWTCPDALWNDLYCDCSCGATDIDCNLPSCSTPGCIHENCDACFTPDGDWKPCEAPADPSLWSCTPTQMNDDLCDCGCTVDDPSCNGEGCSEPGCRKPACDRRHGCTQAQVDQGDDCGKNSLPGPWYCPWDLYAAGNGCDCGCGAWDPDCSVGCSAGRCFHVECDFCHDNQGRPYACDAAQGGWDDDTGHLDTPPSSKCDDRHFDADDGCDCGCGGPDPDCGSDGCETPGCSDPACDRCTDQTFGVPRGCNIPAAWVNAGCAPESYGTGDGCDCGCGADDPDCALGVGCTGDACTASGCDVCHDSTSFIGYVICDDWTCDDPDAFANAECDCGCGVIDPFCRDVAVGAPLYTCTEAGCETEMCEFCNDGATRDACGGGWNAGGCGEQAYGMDGLCDCGCGAPDPDCAADTGCTAPGCQAPGCEVCHAGAGGALQVCYEWTCDVAVFGDGTCDCGCGAIDVDCGSAGNGCREPGCRNAACEVCHDPLGRAVPCP